MVFLHVWHHDSAAGQSVTFSLPGRHLMGRPDVLVQRDVFVVPIAGTRRDGTPHTDTDVAQFRDPTGEYRDRWDLLRLDVPVPEQAT
jgi:hypothetical protein